MSRLFNESLFSLPRPTTPTMYNVPGMFDVIRANKFTCAIVNAAFSQRAFLVPIRFSELSWGPYVHTAHRLMNKIWESLHCVVPRLRHAQWGVKYVVCCMRGTLSFFTQYFRMDYWFCDNNTCCFTDSSHALLFYCCKALCDY